MLTDLNSINKLFRFDKKEYDYVNKPLKGAGGFLTLANQFM